MTDGYVYYGTAKNEDDAHGMIEQQVMDDEWRVLVEPTPLFNAHPIPGKGTLLQYIGSWYMLHRFHKTLEIEQ